MKKALMTVTAAALVSATAPGLHAGDREWATAGKVLAGVGAGLLLTRALQPEPVYAAPPVYVNPAPVVVHQPATVIYQAPPVQQVVVQQQVQYVPAPQPVVVQQPVYVQPAPTVIYQPAPVVYAAPVYVRPAPVYVRPVPVYCPPPAAGFHFSFGSRRHCW
jgi:hypothetical protein